MDRIELVKLAADVLAEKVSLQKQAGASRVWRLLMSGYGPKSSTARRAVQKWVRRMSRYKGLPHPAYLENPSVAAWADDMGSVFRRSGAPGVDGYLKRMNPNAIRSTQPVLPIGVKGGRVDGQEAEFFARLADLARGQGFLPVR